MVYGSVQQNRVSIKHGRPIYKRLTDLWANEPVGEDSDSSISDSE